MPSDQAIRDIVQQMVSSGDTAPSQPAMASMMASPERPVQRFGMMPVADQMIERARGQLASQPERLRPQEAQPNSFAGAFGTGSPAEEASRAPNVVDHVVSGALGSLATLPRRAIENSQYSLDSGTYDPGPTLEAAMLPMGTGAITGVPVRAGEAVLGAGPIRAYHGSPHDFDRFDLSKIGTGEGAQSYGHGLYFAENPQTAQAYRDQLSGRPIALPSVDSPNFQQSMREAIANNAVQVADRNVDAAKRNLTENINRYPPGSNARKDYEAALDMLHENPSKFAGRTYEVNINADPQHFMQWDKPLGAQPRSAQDVLAQSGMRPEAQGPYGKKIGDLPLGSVIGKDLITGPTSPIYQRLNEAGIPGIKYLDQGSRTAGDGSRNFVVFNDKLIDIMRKYGMGSIAALPPAALAAASQNDQSN